MYSSYLNADSFVQDVGNKVNVTLLFFAMIQAELKKKFEEDNLPRVLTNLEKLLKENHGGDSFFVGDTVIFAL